MRSDPNVNIATAAPALGAVGAMTKEGLLGSAQAPIHMVTAEGGLKVQAWRTLRTLALGFLLISGVGALIEDRGIGKGMQADINLSAYYTNFPISWGAVVLMCCVYFIKEYMFSRLDHLVQIHYFNTGLGLNEEVQPSMETSTKFSDVKGVDEAKAELEEIVHYLRDPQVCPR